MRHGAIAGSVLLLVACQGGSSAPPIGSSAGPLAPSAAAPLSLKRKSTPVERRKADESACLAGGAEACRRMADRSRGFGHTAGCGIERPGPLRSIKVQGGSALSVRIKQMSGDTQADRRNLFQWINKACDLGDEEACGIARTARHPRDL